MPFQGDKEVAKRALLDDVPTSNTATSMASVPRGRAKRRLVIASNRITDNSPWLGEVENGGGWNRRDQEENRIGHPNKMKGDQTRKASAFTYNKEH